MSIIRALADTTIVNRILDIDNEVLDDPKGEENRKCLASLMEHFINTGKVKLFVNPSVEREIKNTEKDPRRKQRLLDIFQQLDFTFEQEGIFPFYWGKGYSVKFLTTEEKELLNKLYTDLPKFRKDEKVLGDALFNPNIEVLLTTDEEHLAKAKFRRRLIEMGLEDRLKIFTPIELFNYLGKY